MIYVVVLPFFFPKCGHTLFNCATSDLMREGIYFEMYVKSHTSPSHYSFLMSQKSSCFAAAWDLAPCSHSQCLFRCVLLMPTKFSCLAAVWDLAPCPHFHYLPNDLLHHQAGDRKGKVSNFRWLRDRKIGSGILSSSVNPGKHRNWLSNLLWNYILSWCVA